MWNRFRSVGEIIVYLTLQISTGGGDQESDGFHIQVGVLNITSRKVPTYALVNCVTMFIFFILGLPHDFTYAI